MLTCVAVQLPAALAAPTVVVNSDGSIAVSWRAPDPLPGIITGVLLLHVSEAGMSFRRR